MYNSMGPPMSGYQPRNGAEYIQQLITPPEVFQTMKTVEAVVRILASWLALYVEVFARHSFGSRYLGIGRMVLAMMTMQLLVFLAELRHSLSFMAMLGMKQPFMGLSDTVRWAFIVMCLWHILQIIRRSSRNESWYSRSWGISRLEPLLMRLPGISVLGVQLKITESMTYRIIEPAICAAIIWFFVPDIGNTREFLLISCAAMAVHANINLHAMRENYLNIVDAQIAGQFFGQMQPDGSLPRAKETAGYPVMPVPHTLSIAGTDKEMAVTPDYTAQPVRTITKEGDK